MKKLVTIILILVLSCSKDKKEVCWYCELHVAATGQTLPPQTVCLPEGKEPGGFKDANGNEVNYYCKKQ